MVLLPERSLREPPLPTRTVLGLHPTALEGGAGSRESSRLLLLPPPRKSQGGSVMAASARWNHVWVGSETGILKGVNLVRKQAVNFTEAEGRPRREEEVSALCWADAAESQILIGCANGTVKSFSTEEGKFLRSRCCPGGEGTFRGLAKHDGCLITCVESGILRVWPEDSSEHITQLSVGPSVCRMRQDPDRPHIVATGGKENSLKVWDLQASSQEPIFRAKNVRNDWLNLRVPIWDQDIQFLPGSQKIVTCTGHHQVRVYDLASPQRRPVLETIYGEYPLMAMTLTAGGNSVVVGNTHGQLAEIDLRQGRLVCCLKGLAGSVRGLQCHPTQPILASCGLDRVLRVHRLREPRGLEHKVYLKSRLNCLLLSGRHNWEDEPTDPAPVPSEEPETDELWDSLEPVVAGAKRRQRSLEAQPGGKKKQQALGGPSLLSPLCK
ncbi:WD repeat-containing protein 74 isoform X1 [Trichosurus vulpecula]|uniref:WD repeat-containing protein 74 isoform X1 n=1 Tax=Trichosurus vulpecula TaxID=9337 RepID=UPI00186B2BA5|nr:WD repeat-containing protein 74 isoform X1 [Trichosurus vulpecula]